MVEQKQSVNRWSFIVGILLLAFSNIFAVSGYANMIFYTELATILTLVLLIFGMAINMEKKQVSKLDIVLGITCLGYLAFIVFAWKTFYQLTNLLTLFGIFAWVKIFSKFQWDKEKYATCGIICSIYSVVMIYLFLPGSILSGWNENSSICIIPVLFFAISCLMESSKKWSKFAIVATLIMIGVLILQLENRSAFFAVILFTVVLLSKKIYTNKIAFRVLYISIIALNVLLPLFFEGATSTTIFKKISDFLSDLFDKNGLNGREELWALALSKIQNNPWLGTRGYRTTYFHNFSLDVLIQFGWVGWIVFFGVLIYILEKSFKEGETRNLFLIGFLCLLFLNTFESVLFCNNYFMPFSYLLIGMCWNKNTTKEKLLAEK